MTKEVQQAKYVSLATFRKTGVKVATPVWMAPADPTQPERGYYVFSAGNAGKVKRLRNNNAVELAHCDVRGGLLGDWHPAVADLVTDDVSINQALDALHQKYGWQMWIADVGAKLTGKFSKRAYIRVRFESTPG